MARPEHSIARRAPGVSGIRRSGDFGHSDTPSLVIVLDSVFAEGTLENCHVEGIEAGLHPQRCLPFVDGALRRSYDRIEQILGVANAVEKIDRCNSIDKQTTLPLTQQVKPLAGWSTVGPAASAMETASANFSRRPHPGQTGTS